ncbi:MAG: RHS repeat domain-containing protein [Marinobacter sp.]|uniref:RHS repeat domain-containing protein n=1 Tax=Marinobacter sp. TaxID=50741 RepID=UPI003F98BE64
MTRAIWNTLATLAVLIFTALPLSAAEVVTYYHNDHLGSPIAATDSTGAVVWQQAYDPWGFKLTANTDERGYTGNWLDEETGLADHKARWYTSSIGRFTGIDPVKWQESNIHSFNRYAYASNNPYAYVDRDGRNAVAAFGGLIVESANAIRGKGFNGSRVLGALADGYNGEGEGFVKAATQDALSFIPAGAVAGGLFKGARLTKLAAIGGKARSLDDLSSLRGAKLKDIEKMADAKYLQSGWTKRPLKDGNGIRYFDGKGNSFQLNNGYSGGKNLHGGPYIKTTRGNETVRIPLKGNPDL